MCPLGFFSNSTAASGCLDCRSGFYAPQNGSTVCSSCLDGYVAPINAVSCSPCAAGKFSSGPSGLCTACPLHSTTFRSASQTIAECLCDVGSFGFSFKGDDCQICSKGIGILCARVNLTMPELLPGYFRNPNLQTSALTCIPSEACLASSQFDLNTPCAVGYTGFLCGDCIVGKYYRQGIVCTSCPSKVAQIFSWITIIVVGLIALIVAARRVEQVSGELKILIFWIQILSIYPSMSPSWPPSLRNFLQLLSGINFDIQVTSPGTFFSLL
jgi:hypothetical protein